MSGYQCHAGYSCDDCGTKPIFGVRHNLPSSNYDLCHKCFEKLPPAEKTRYNAIAPGRVGLVAPNQGGNKPTTSQHAIAKANEEYKNSKEYARSFDKEHHRKLAELLRLPENQYCADCARRDPQWASVNLGVFICLKCSGIHRSLGTHVSQVRSVSMDSWFPAQIATMVRFGNARARGVWEARVPRNCLIPTEDSSEQQLELCASKAEPSALLWWMRSKYEQRSFLAEDPKTAPAIEKPLQHGRSSSSSSSSNSSSSPRRAEEKSKSKHKSSKHKSKGIESAAALEEDLIGSLVEPAPASSAAPPPVPGDGDWMQSLIDSAAPHPASDPASAAPASPLAPASQGAKHRVVAAAVVRQTAEMDSAKIYELSVGDEITEHNRLQNSAGQWRVQCSGPGIIGRGWVSLKAADGTRILAISTSSSRPTAAISIDLFGDGAGSATCPSPSPSPAPQKANGNGDLFGDLFGSAAPAPAAPAAANGSLGMLNGGSIGTVGGKAQSQVAALQAELARERRARAALEQEVERYVARGPQSHHQQNRH